MAVHEFFTDFKSLDVTNFVCNLSTVRYPFPCLLQTVFFLLLFSLRPITSIRRPETRAPS